MNSKLSCSIPPSKDPFSAAAEEESDGIWNGKGKLFDSWRPIKRMKKLDLPAANSEKSWRYDIPLNLLDTNYNNKKKLGLGFMAMSGATLPQEIEEAILLQLFVRSLLRFKAVSKEFHSLISSPRFISHHMSKAQQLSIVRCRWNNIWSLLRNSPHTAHAPVHEAFDHHIGGLPVQDNFYLVGSANGLLCLQPLVRLPDSENRPYVLWNPATRQFKNIPPHSIKLMSLIFGYRSGIHEDYILFGVSKPSGAIHVFSLRQGSWRTVNCSMDTHQWDAFLFDSTLRVMLNGIFYFLLGSCDSRPKLELLVFDCESLTRMSLPAGAPDQLWNLALCVSNGRLLLFSLRAGVLNVWAMRKSSWTMLHTADLSAAGFSISSLRLQTPYWQGSRVLVDVRKSGEHQERTWSYDMLTSSWIEIDSLMPEKLYIFEAWDYVESLVPPAGEFLLKN